MSACSSTMSRCSDVWWYYLWYIK